MTSSFSRPSWTEETDENWEVSRRELGRLQAGLWRGIADQRLRRRIDAATLGRAQDLLTTVEYLSETGTATP